MSAAMPSPQDKVVVLVDFCFVFAAVGCMLFYMYAFETANEKIHRHKSKRKLETKQKRETII
jgi:hypothetical protein